MDREKVISGINKILEETDEYDGVLWDTLTLLQEQEAVEPTWQQGKAYCGACGKRIPLKIKSKFCHKCGKPVMWGGRRRIDIPDEIKRRFSIGSHLRGISKYLLDEYGDCYKKFQVGKRLLHYIDIAEVSTEKQRLKEYIWQDSDDGYTSTRIRELIRCKDCINYVESIFGDGMFCGCDGMLRDPDWYCADGERKA